MLVTETPGPDRRASRGPSRRLSCWPWRCLTGSKTVEAGESVTHPSPRAGRCQQGRRRSRPGSDRWRGPRTLRATKTPRLDTTMSTTADIASMDIVSESEYIATRTAPAANRMTSNSDSRSRGSPVISCHSARPVTTPAMPRLEAGRRNPASRMLHPASFSASC